MLQQWYYSNISIALFSFYFQLAIIVTLNRIYFFLGRCLTSKIIWHYPMTRRPTRRWPRPFEDRNRQRESKKVPLRYRSYSAPRYLIILIICYPNDLSSSYTNHRRMSKVRSREIHETLRGRKPNLMTVKLWMNTSFIHGHNYLHRL